MLPKSTVQYRDIDAGTGGLRRAAGGGIDIRTEKILLFPVPERTFQITDYSDFAGACRFSWQFQYMVRMSKAGTFRSENEQMNFQNGNSDGFA